MILDIATKINASRFRSEGFSSFFWLKYLPYMSVLCAADSLVTVANPLANVFCVLLVDVLFPNNCSRSAALFHCLGSVFAFKSYL